MDVLQCADTNVSLGNFCGEIPWDKLDIQIVFRLCEPKQQKKIKGRRESGMGRKRPSGALSLRPPLQVFLYSMMDPVPVPRNQATALPSKSEKREERRLRLLNPKSSFSSRITQRRGELPSLSTVPCLPTMLPLFMEGTMS